MPAYFHADAQAVHFAARRGDLERLKQLFIDHYHAWNELEDAAGDTTDTEAVLLTAGAVR